jgi:hypothetical protein
MNARLMLEYRGEQVTDYRGMITPAGQPYRFGLSKFNLPIEWTVSFYNWDASKVADPRGAMPSLSDLAKTGPVHTMKTGELNFAWPGSPAEGVGADHFATTAEATIDVPAGTYVLHVTTDDGCRVWVDDRLVVEDAWKYQGPTLYSRELALSGKHRIRIEHYEIDGYSALKVELKPKA